jgi:hypothetical protein
VKLDGKPLAAPGAASSRSSGARADRARGDEDEDEGASWEMENEETPAAARNLIEFANRLKDGQKVAVEYRRGGESRTTTIVVRQIQRRMIVRVPEGEVIQEDFSEILTPPAPAPALEANLAALARLYPLRHMELVSLNPDLASYFNTDRGLLVVRVPPLKGIQLRSGDVILKIGGEEPSTPSRAVRIFREHDPESPLPLLVLRKGKPITIHADLSGLESEAPRPPKAPRAPGSVPPPSPPPEKAERS